MTPGVDTVVIVDPSAKPPEDWYCVATAEKLGPWWTVLVTRAGVYCPTTVGGADRERVLAGVRENGLPEQLFGPFKGWLAVAAHPNHAVVLPGEAKPTYINQGFVPMTPKRIPFCGTEHEVLDRVRLTAARDKEFARKWAGWRFLAIRHDDGVLL